MAKGQIGTAIPPKENPLPVAGHGAGHTSHLSEQDYARMALRESRMRAGAPTALPTLSGVDSISIATRYLTGGREQFIEIAQLAMLNNEPLACKWWAVYADLAPYPRSLVSFDDVCAAAGVEPAALCGLLVSTAMRMGRDVANMVAALTHPKVVAAQVRSAERIDGPDAEIAYKDRVAFLQGMGFLPVPKSAQIIISAHASSNAQAAAAVSTEPTVPSFTQDMVLAGAGTTGTPGTPGTPDVVVPAEQQRALPVANDDQAPIDASVAPDDLAVGVPDPADRDGRES